ncbi:MAG TPA: HU family DNA-binding protein [Bacteroidales bacterium]|nr:HU family DNA-binding protein [Bacteroidales bacterium]
MAISYVVNQRVNPRNIQAPRKFYAMARSISEETTRKLATEISKRTGSSVSDVMAVLEAFIDLIPERLLDGFIVRLGDFGSFSLTLSSEGVEKADDFNQTMIKGININFRPGKIVDKVLSTADYKRISE